MVTYRIERDVGYSLAQLMDHSTQKVKKYNSFTYITSRLPHEEKKRNQNGKNMEEELKENKLEEVNDDANHTNINVFLLICIVGVSLAILLEIINVQNRQQKASNNESTQKPLYWVYSANNDVEKKDGLLKHVHLVLGRAGYEKSSNKTPWHLLWSHDYPFVVLNSSLQNLKPHQKVNHFPSTGFITNKVDLATSDSKYIPKAFKLPKQKDIFLKYAKDNKNSLFLQKNNQHRGIYLKNVSEIDLTSGKSFVQEFVQKPFLVDGHKFDIGVYVVLTSVNPLRVYWYKSDVIFRYCPTKYYPFDPRNLDKYVVGDDYLPTWEVPSLAHPYTALGSTMKQSFDLYARSKGKDPAKMWVKVLDAIAEVFVKKEHHIIQALKRYPSQDNFFELMRFDFIVDEELNVFLLEANMSPNLSSAHYPPNQLLYEQVLYNLFSLTGVANQGKGNNDPNAKEQTASQNMVSSQKNVAVWVDECSTICKDDCSADLVCGLCKPCIDATLRKSLLKAHTENLLKGDFRRLLPPSMKPGTIWNEKSMNMTQNNKLQHLWYQGKCNEDITWCN